MSEMGAAVDLSCSGCGDPIAPHTKFLCIYLTKNGFVLEVGCHHFMPPLIDGRPHDYVFGGSNCFHEWLWKFEMSLKACDHRTH